MTATMIILWILAGVAGWIGIGLLVTHRIKPDRTMAATIANVLLWPIVLLIYAGMWIAFGIYASVHGADAAERWAAELLASTRKDEDR